MAIFGGSGLENETETSEFHEMMNGGERGESDIDAWGESENFWHQRMDLVKVNDDGMAVKNDGVGP
jgi:hypothetical protein